MPLPSQMEIKWFEHVKSLPPSGQVLEIKIINLPVSSLDDRDGEMHYYSQKWPQMKYLLEVSENTLNAILIIFAAAVFTGFSHFASFPCITDVRL